MVDKQNKGKTNNKKDNNDELDKDLGTILRESTLLTTVSGIFVWISPEYFYKYPKRIYFRA
ncbi:MAG: hypothetical protein ACTHKF_09695 [Candidatus Nitrosocosmicus sp.]